MKKQSLYTLAALVALSIGSINPARADLAYTGITSWSITGNYGDVLALNGISASDMIIGTTAFYDSGNIIIPVGSSPFEQAANSDDFSLATTTSANAPMAYIQTMFSVPTTTIFLLEKNGNDTGTFQSLDASGNNVGAALSFVGGGPGWISTGYLSHLNQGVTDPAASQLAYGTVITSDVPIYGIRLNSPGIDPVSIMAVPEPATVGLLGIGVLMLLRRKR
jgi:hypothetical protein